MIRYVCKNCEAKFSTQKTSMFCPYCGTDQIISDSSAYAQRLIDECNAMVPELETSWEKYISLAAQFDVRVMKLHQYKKRGYITEEMMPKYRKKTMKEAMKEARQSK